MKLISFGVLAALWLVPRVVEAKGCATDCQKKRIEEGIQEKRLAPLATACGVEIQLRVDWTSFDEDGLKNWERYNTVLICGEPLRQLRMDCGNARGKATVKAKVKSYTCGWSATKQKPSLTLKGGALRYMVAFEVSKHYNVVQKNLERLLGHKFPFKVADPYNAE